MNSFKLNSEYASILGAYWMIYGITGSFASVFMLEKGYSNMQIGMTLAAANLLAFVLQPFLADRMDRVRGTGMIDASVFMTLAMMLAGTGYFVFSEGSFMLAGVIIIILALHALLQPGFNSLAFRLSESGTKVNYGMGRAGGSLGFSAILAVLGTMVEKHGVMSIPVCAESACLLLIALLLLTKRSFNGMKRAADDAGRGMQSKDLAADRAGRGMLGGDPAADKAPDEDERIDLRSFIKRNKYFFIMNIGIAGLFFSNSVLSNYMAQIADNVGGTTEQVGRILSLMALAEMPTMVFYDKIHKRFSSRSLIRLASAGFTAKMAVCWMAGSVSLLYAAQVFQLAAFALIMPAMVIYVDEIMSRGEAVKGQALFTMMITLSTIAASFAGGWIMDAHGVSTLNLVSLMITAAGAAVVILSIGKVKSHK